MKDIEISRDRINSPMKDTKMDAATVMASESVLGLLRLEERKALPQ